MNIKDTLRVLMPDFWIMLGKYNPRWDKLLNEAIDKGVVTKICSRVVQIDNLSVWVANYPSGYATPYSMGVKIETARPSRLTILRLKRFLEEAGINSLDLDIDAAIVKS